MCALMMTPQSHGSLMMSSCVYILHTQIICVMHRMFTSNGIHIHTNVYYCAPFRIPLLVTNATYIRIYICSVSYQLLDIGLECTTNYKSNKHSPYSSYITHSFNFPERKTCQQRKVTAIGNFVNHCINISIINGSVAYLVCFNLPEKI